MRTTIKDGSGFTFIELMIVVTIIGVLAAIAIPNYMKNRTKAKQVEAKINLKAVYVSELSYYSEKARYTDMLSDLEWRPMGVCVYRYTAGGDFAGNPDPDGNPMNAGTPAASEDAYTAVAWANIDSDPAVDTWEATSSNPPWNTYDDTAQTETP